MNAWDAWVSICLSISLSSFPFSILLLSSLSQAFCLSLSCARACVCVCWHRLEDACLAGGLERRDVPDVRDRVAVGRGTGALDLVELVVQEEVLLPLRVEDPALVSV